MSEKSNILIADDERSMRDVLEIILKKEGYNSFSAASGREAIEIIKKEDIDLLLCDIRLGDISGIDVLRAAKQYNPNTVVIMISAYATPETAVEAMKEGAYDFLPKPFDNDELKEAISKALHVRTVDQEKQVLDDALKKNLHFGRIIGNSPQMLHIYEMVLQVSRTKTNVLITGESGTGKELIARSIHEQSDRQDKPFIPINCGGIPETLMESELFGHKKGSFTGATADKKGLFEIADGGTVFLDEIGEIGNNIQVKLLRAVQDKVFKPVGGNEDITVDIRIISATNRNLEEDVIYGRFREDLFYRLNVIEIKVPPLRERKEDLPLLAQHFLDKYSKEMAKEVTKMSAYAINLLKIYDFPGNIRELENLIERSVALTNTKILLPDSLALSTHKRKYQEEQKQINWDLEEICNGVLLDNIIRDTEKAYITKALEIAGGKREKAAKLLGITNRSLRYRMYRLGMKI